MVLGLNVVSAVKKAEQVVQVQVQEIQGEEVEDRDIGIKVQIACSRFRIKSRGNQSIERDRRLPGVSRSSCKREHFLEQF